MPISAIVIPWLHIVLTARTAKLPRLHELKLKGVLHHIPRQTFELAPKEIAAYYRLCGVSLSESRGCKQRTTALRWRGSPTGRISPIMRNPALQHWPAPVYTDSGL